MNLLEIRTIWLLELSGYTESIILTQCGKLFKTPPILPDTDIYKLKPSEILDELLLVYRKDLDTMIRLEDDFDVYGHIDYNNLLATLDFCNSKMNVSFGKEVTSNAQ